MKKNLAIFSLFFILLSSCTTVHSKSERVVTSYMGTSYLKYYVRPDKMVSTNFKEDRAFVMIDFSYQKDERAYVSDAYVNFTLHYLKDAYIDTAAFELRNGEVIALENINTLDRNVRRAFIRVPTLLKQSYVEAVLDDIADSSALLNLTLEGGEKKSFSVSHGLAEKIQEAFTK